MIPACVTAEKRSTRTALKHVPWAVSGDCRSKDLAHIIKKMSPLPTKKEKSRTCQEVNYTLMSDVEIIARLFDSFGESIGMFFQL